MLLPKLAQVMMGQANVSGERSTVLHSILWLLGIICILCVSIAFSRLDVIVLYIAMAIFTVVLVFFGYVYLKCLDKDPDLLRSEKYALQKLTIQNSIHGDSDIGVIENNVQETNIRAVSAPEIQGEQQK